MSLASYLNEIKKLYDKCITINHQFIFIEKEFNNLKQNIRENKHRIENLSKECLSLSERATDNKLEIKLLSKSETENKNELKDLKKTIEEIQKNVLVMGTRQNDCSKQIETKIENFFYKKFYDKMTSQNTTTTQQLEDGR